MYIQASETSYYVKKMHTRKVTFLGLWNLGITMLEIRKTNQTAQKWKCNS